jgi:diaminopimelate epimerase
MNTFEKYHALGNDYLVYDPKAGSGEFSEGDIIRICHRNFGLGSDGILVGPLPSEKADFGLRILNPDGSEAEKSGNGLRIFARFLNDQGKVQSEPFTVDTLGGVVTCEVSEDTSVISVEMGQVSFHSDVVPVNVTGEAREVLGPTLETHPNFPNRTNVQFLQVLNRNRIKIEIWERGAGYTLASGSSSSAAGAVARKMGTCDSEITVEMPGGELGLVIDDEFNVQMTGPATRVATMSLDDECLRAF